MKYSIFILLLFTVHHHRAQITLIPDSAFEAHLVSTGVDTDGTINGQVLTADVEDETDLTLFMHISDLTGIQDFTSLENLGIDVLPITQLDLSQNIQLELLRVDVTLLKSLDLSNNVNLKGFIFDGGHCTGCSYQSPITAIDLSQNLLLEDVSFYGSVISNIDLSNNPELKTVRMSNNAELESVNLKNGNNTNINFLRIQNNTSLNCVQVDDPTAVIAGVNPPYDNWIIENNPIISEDCFLGLEHNLASQISLFPNPVANNLRVDITGGLQIEKIELFDLQGRMVMSSINIELIDLSNLENGVYIIYITTDLGTLSQKVIKH